MISIIRNFFKGLKHSQEKKVLLENFFSLSFLQAANYILPLITLPYLVRVLGPEKFGLIAFAQAFIQYFVIVTNYGFELSATREISINRNDSKKVSEIFSSVSAIKFVLMCASFLVMSAVVFAIPKFRNDWLVYFFTFGTVLDTVLFPVWFFQGMERMRYITIRNVSAKLIFTMAIFIFIKKQSDYVYVPFINSLGFIVAGTLGLIYLFRNFDVKFFLPTFGSIKYHCKDGWNIFVSRVATNLYTTSNTFFLGLFTNNTIVGYFAAGEKIVRTMISLFNPVFQSFYPHITKLAAESKEKAISKLNKLFKVSFIVSFVIFVIILTFSRPLANVLLGTGYQESIYIVRILSPLLVIIPAAYIFANLALLPFKLDKYFSRIYVSGGLINIFLLSFFLFVLNLGGKGVALANLITETTLTLIMYFVLRKHSIKIIL